MKGSLSSRLLLYVFAFVLLFSPTAVAFGATIILSGSTDSQTTIRTNNNTNFTNLNNALGSPFPFTPTTNYGALTNSTSTRVFFTAGLLASSTSHLVNFDFANATSSGSLSVSASTTLASVLNLGGQLNANLSAVIASTTLTGKTLLTNATTTSFAVIGSTTIASVLNALAGANFGTLTATGLDTQNGGFYSTASSTLSASFFSTLNNYLGSTTLAGNTLFANATSTGSLAVTGSTTVTGQLNAVAGGTFGAITVSSCTGCGGGNTFGKTLEIDSSNWISPTSTIYGINTSSQGLTYGLGIGDQLVGYASSTNGAAIFGLSAGGPNATTSNTLAGTTAVGFGALSALTTGTENTAVGYNAGAKLKAQVGYTLLGYGACPNCTSGGSTVALGSDTLNGATGESFDVIIGAGAGGLLSAGKNNVVIGYQALGGGGTGGNRSNNTLIGWDSGLILNAGANNNTLLGYQSGASVTTGTGNILLGAAPDIGNLTTGNGNILIGFNPFATSPSVSNTLNLGGLVFGTLPATSTAFQLPTSGAIGIGSSSPYAKLSVQTNNGDTATTLFAIGSSTATATTTLFSISNTGLLTGLDFSFRNGTTTGSLAVTGSTTVASVLNVGGTFNGAGLGSCTGGTNALTWSSGSFGCQSISATGGFNFTQQSQYGLNTSATTTLLQLTNGLTASSTSHFVNFDFANATSSGSVAITASTTIGGQLNAVSGATFGNASTSVFSSSLSAFLSTTGGQTNIGTSTTNPQNGLNIGSSTNIQYAQFGGAIASSTSNCNGNTTVNWDTGNTQRLIETGSCGLIVNATSSQPRDGHYYVLNICQDSSGSRATTFLTPGQLVWSTQGTTSPNQGVYALTSLLLQYDGRASRYFAVASSTTADARICQP